MWKTKAERGSTGLIRLIAWLAKSLGRSFCRALLYPIVLYFVLTDAVARRSSCEFLSSAIGSPAAWIDVFRHLYWFAATLLDRVYLSSGEFHRFQITVQGDALVQGALSRGKGCLLLGSHLGSFDLMLLANKQLRGHPVNILMQLDARSRVRRIAGIDDSSHKVIALGRPDSLLRAYESLERGEIVALLADRVDGSASTLEASFLGKPVDFPLAPHILAARTGVPVLMCFGLYEGGRQYRIVFVEFGPPAPADSRSAMLQAVVDRYASILERFARQNPNNWFNFYPYWSRQRSS